MDARLVVPILNVSDVPASFEWFAKLGWRKQFDWCATPGGPAVFGGVIANECEIFICQDNQGGRGEHAAWVSIWVDDVDAVHERCVAEGLVVVRPPADEVWNVREMHLRHPDGHIFRIGHEIAEAP